VISAILVAIACFTFLPVHFAGSPASPTTPSFGHGDSLRWLVIGAVLIGLVLASAFQLLTGYFTETNRRPVRHIGELADRSRHRHPVRHGVRRLLGAADRRVARNGSAPGNATIALFAVTLAGTDTLTAVGVIVSMDCFGPVTDNAQGIAEMSATLRARRRSRT
jgi:K(+)-stimulated pyrophosphate-energized sodium pump